MWQMLAGIALHEQSRERCWEEALKNIHRITTCHAISEQSPSPRTPQPASLIRQNEREMGKVSSVTSRYSLLTCGQKQGLIHVNCYWKGFSNGKTQAVFVMKILHSNSAINTNNLLLCIIKQALENGVPCGRWTDQFSSRVVLILRTINQSHLQFNKPVFSLLKNFLEILLTT